MSKQEKKVVLFIVEGPSDEAAIGPIMKEYFANDTVEFKVVHGDITSAKNVNSENIIKKINEQLEVVKEKYRYKDTWKFIQKDINSLQRHSNMNLIFNSKALDNSLEFEYAMEE